MNTLEKLLTTLKLFNEMVDTSPPLLETEIGREIAAACQQIAEKQDRIDDDNDHH